MPTRPRSTRAASAVAPAQTASRAARRPTVEGLGDDDGAAELGRRLAESLRRLRGERQMSLDELALASGVSRAALSQIEAARTNATLGLLWVETRLLSLSGGADRPEIYELRFQPKGALRSEAHGAGASETVIILTGALRVTVGDETHDLGVGDSLFFQANVQHSYENLSPREARCIDTIGYGRS